MKSSVNRKTRRSTNEELARKTMIVVLWAVIITSTLGAILMFVNLAAVLQQPKYETYIVARERTASLYVGMDTCEIRTNVTHEQSISQKAVEENTPEEKMSDPMDTVYDNLGEAEIDVGESTLVRYDLPNVYYGDVDFSSFQPYMSYKCITAEGTEAYEISHSDLAYTDENGMRRYETNDSQFTINGQDDYVFALGTFYKPRGTCGSRWLVITSTGAYTAITGDEKADYETDDLGMFSRHGDDGNTLGLIEWIVDYDMIDSNVWAYGSVTAGPIEAIQGEIEYIYQIQ